MSKRDRLYAGALSLLSFILCSLRYWYPPERYFDEIYYPRSAAEYLLWRPQYEWTHPPLTKLLIALSMLLWGGMHSPLGNTGYGWRFLNLVVGAAMVYIVYAFAKRLTGSTPFAALAAGFLAIDGFHFVESRMATPEITVAFLMLAILYAFYRYWIALDGETVASPPVKRLVLASATCIAGATAVSWLLIGLIAHQSGGSVALIAVFLALAGYAAWRLRAGPVPARGWMWWTAIACALGAASKWNAMFDLVLVLAVALGIVLLPRPKWRLPLDLFASLVLATTMGVYLASYIPSFAIAHPATYETKHDLDGFIDLQKQMFIYHDYTVALEKPHPYSSKWWEWPLLYQPVAYWYQDFRKGAAANDPNACCLGEIIAIPNPLTWWFGLLSVPFLGYLAWLRRGRGELLLLLAYFAQWLPWIASPRMLFEYHFLPNLPIIILADVLLLHWFWDRAQTPEGRRFAAYGITIFAAATLTLSIYFYPVLAGDSITYAQWSARMWFPHWISGPG